MSVFCTSIILLYPDEDYNSVVEMSAIFDDCLVKFRLELKLSAYHEFYQQTK